MEIQRQAHAYTWRVAAPNSTGWGREDFSGGAGYDPRQEAIDDAQASWEDSNPVPPSDEEYGPPSDSGIPPAGGDIYDALDLMLSHQREQELQEQDPNYGVSNDQLQDILESYGGPGDVDDEEHWSEQRHSSFRQAVGIGAPLPGQGQPMSFKPKNYLPNWKPGEAPKRPIPGVNDESDYNFTGSPETQYHHRSIQPNQRENTQALQDSQGQLYDLMRGGMSFDEAKGKLQLAALQRRLQASQQG